MTFEPNTKRINQRHEVQIPMKIIIDTTEKEVIIQNISVGGLYFEDIGDYKRKDVYKISFSIPTMDKPIECEIIIRWVETLNLETDLKGIGAQFLGITAKEVWSMSKYFTTLAAQNDDDL